MRGGECPLIPTLGFSVNRGKGSLRRRVCHTPMPKRPGRRSHGEAVEESWRRQGRPGLRLSYRESLALVGIEAPPQTPQTPF